MILRHASIFTFPRARNEAAGKSREITKIRRGHEESNKGDVGLENEDVPGRLAGFPRMQNARWRRAERSKGRARSPKELSSVTIHSRRSFMDRRVALLIDSAIPASYLSHAFIIVAIATELLRSVLLRDFRAISLSQNIVRPRRWLVRFARHSPSRGT